MLPQHPRSSLARRETNLAVALPDVGRRRRQPSDRPSSQVHGRDLSRTRTPRSPSVPGAHGRPVDRRLLPGRLPVIAGRLPVRDGRVTPAASATAPRSLATRSWRALRAESGRRSTALGRDSIAGSCAWSTSGRGWRVRGRGGVQRPSAAIHRRVVRVEHEWARLRSRGGVQRPSAAIRSPGRARGATSGQGSGSARHPPALGHDSIAESCAWGNIWPGFGVWTASVGTCPRVLR